MCTTPHPTCKLVLAALVLDFSSPMVVIAAPAEVAKVMAKKIFSVPTPGAVVDASAVLDSRSQSLTVHGVRGIRRRVRA